MKVTEREDTLRSLQESIAEHIQKNADLLKVIQQKESDLEQQVRMRLVSSQSPLLTVSSLLLKNLPVNQTKELECVQMQKEQLLSSVKEDRENMHRQEQQLQAQLQDQMESHQLEVGRSVCLAPSLPPCEALTLTSHTGGEDLWFGPSSSPQVAELRDSLQTVTEQKIHLEDDLKDSREKVREHSMVSAFSAVCWLIVGGNVRFCFIHGLKESNQGQ